VKVFFLPLGAFSSVSRGWLWKKPICWGREMVGLWIVFGAQNGVPVLCHKLAIKPSTGW